MDSFLWYLFQVSCVFAVLYLVYYLFFRWMTFHRVNRVFLLLMIPVSFIIPGLDVGFKTSMAGEIQIPAFDELVSMNQPEQVLSTATSFGINPNKIVIALYWFFVLIYLFRLVFSSFRLLRVKNKSAYSNDEGFLIIAADVPVIFSYFNWIFIPVDRFDEFEEPVIKHEKMHVVLGHTFDLIMTEVLILLLWFNPFVYFFRKSIKSVHEYQVDSLILKSEVQKSDYLRMILDNLGSGARLNGLYNYFNGITIKKRIKMITTNNTSRIHLVWYLMIIPILGFLVMSFANPIGEKPEVFPIRKGEYDKITAYFGVKMLNPVTKKEVVHNGIDLKAKEGVSVLSTAGGKVLKAANEEGWGNLVVIEHGDGFESWYAHLKEFKVEAGQDIQKGQLLGLVGNTGYSTGPHLHFEIRFEGRCVDPLLYLKE